jgi:hypothetical protein
MAACALISFLILALGRKKIAYKAKWQDVEEQAVDLVEKY